MLLCDHRLATRGGIADGDKGRRWILLCPDCPGIILVDAVIENGVIVRAKEPVGSSTDL